MAKKSKHDVLNIEVGVVMTDAQDGSWTVEIFPSYAKAEAARLKDVEDGGGDPENISDLEYGYLSKEMFKFKLVNGKLVLTKPVFLSTDD